MRYVTKWLAGVDPYVFGDPLASEAVLERSKPSGPLALILKSAFWMLLGAAIVTSAFLGVTHLAVSWPRAEFFNGILVLLFLGMILSTASYGEKWMIPASGALPGVFMGLLAGVLLSMRLDNGECFCDVASCVATECQKAEDALGYVVGGPLAGGFIGAFVLSTFVGGLSTVQQWKDRRSFKLAPAHIFADLWQLGRDKHIDDEGGVTWSYFAVVRFDPGSGDIKVKSLISESNHKSLRAGVPVPVVFLPDKPWIALLGDEL